MREIKFRGISENTGMWVYGFLVKSNNLQGYLIYNEYGELKKVKEKTIGQFTGLVDKNGKEIFEGDIVKGSLTDLRGEAYNVYGKVAFADGYSGYGILPLKSTNFGDSYVIINPNLKVIGNIYENEDLLATT